MKDTKSAPAIKPVRPSAVDAAADAAADAATDISDITASAGTDEVSATAPPTPAAPVVTTEEYAALVAVIKGKGVAHLHGRSAMTIEELDRVITQIANTKRDPQAALARLAGAPVNPLIGHYARIDAKALGDAVTAANAPLLAEISALRDELALLKGGEYLEGVEGVTLVGHSDGVAEIIAAAIAPLAAQIAALSPLPRGIA